LKDSKLSVYCKSCNERIACDETPPHPYNNPVWHGCIHKKDIVLDMMGA